MLVRRKIGLILIVIILLCSSVALAFVLKDNKKDDYKGTLVQSNFSVEVIQNTDEQLNTYHVYRV